MTAAARARRVRRLGLCVSVAATAAAIVVAAMARAVAADETLAADLSQDQVTITTGFTGSKVLFFGATNGPGDVVVLVIGPPQPIVVRHKDKVSGIWINRESMTFPHAPGFYAIAASDALKEIVPDAIARRYQIGLDYLKLVPAGKPPPARARIYRRALVRNMIRRDLYKAGLRGIVFPDRGQRLFRTEIFFPADVPTGNYKVRFLLLRDGKLIATFDRTLVVKKGGVSAEVFHFAHQDGVIYGLLAILIAVVAGWGASQLFRRS